MSVKLLHIRVPVKCSNGGFTYNTGSGDFVLQMIKAFSQVQGDDVRYKITARCDAAEVLAEAKKAEEELAWMTQYGLQERLSPA